MTAGLKTIFSAAAARRFLAQAGSGVFLLLGIVAVQAPASEASPVESNGVFEFGEFALHVPADVSRVRGILLALGGPDTRAFVADRSFNAPVPELETSLRALARALRMLAAEHDLAMLGVSLRGREAMPNAPRSDGIIIDALNEAAGISGHRELASAPLFLYGISGGALPAAGFTARQPGRVGALLLKVPGPPGRLGSAEALAVPTLLILAEHDDFTDNAAVVAAFESNRRVGGLWAIAVQPGVPHHSLTPDHRALTVNWLRASVALRLGASQQDPLHVVPESAGWLGHAEVGVSDWDGYSGDRRAASWFPSQATAEEWLEFTGNRKTR